MHPDWVVPAFAQGEYGLTNVLMSHGYNIATLMARYSPVRFCPSEFPGFVAV